MDIDDIILDLKGQIQQLEDAKTQLTEAQEDLRQTICHLEMTKEV